MPSEVASPGDADTHGQSETPGSQHDPSTASRTKQVRDLAAIVCLLLFITAIFYKTVFIGEPISKVARLTLWDSAFKSLSSGTSGLMDPSLLQLMLPYYFMVAKLWHAGQIPLWNPYSGCGVPLLADPQSEVFSPLHSVLALFPNMRAYNLVIVFELAFGAVGTFLLSRSLGISRIAAVLAAVSFAFCPFIDWFLELIGNGYMFYPLVFWLFVLAAKKPTLARAGLAGLGTAAMILSGHPEVTFFGAVFGASLNMLLLALNAFGNAAHTTANRLLRAARQTGFAALIAFCLSAPLLIPFAEYLANAQSYKFASKTVEFIPLPALMLNLLQPALGGASFYLGILPLVSLPFCFLIRERLVRKRVSAMAVIALVSEAFTAQIWPMNMLSAALSMLIPNYCQPIVLLALAITAAFGFDQLMQHRLYVANKIGQGLIASVLIAILLPLAIRLSHIPLDTLAFDTSLSAAKLGSHAWQNIAIFGGIITIALLAASSNRFAKWKPYFFIACIALSWLTQFEQSKLALPVQPHFDYPEVKTTVALKQAGSRYITVGEHLLRPNTNVVYGIEDLRFHNPIFPKRYRSFMQSCGATLDGFNETFDGAIKQPISLASVQNVLSHGPAWSFEAMSQTKCEKLPAPIKWRDIQIDGHTWAYDRENKQLIFKLSWSSLTNLNRNITYSIVLLNDSGDLVWFSDQYRLAPRRNKAKQEVKTFEQQLAAPIRDEWNKENLHVGIRLFDNSTAKFLPMESGSEIAELFALTPINCSPQQLHSDPQFKFLKNVDDSVRMYQNTKALPNAYLVNAVRIADGETEALSKIEDVHVFDGTEAIVEYVFSASKQDEDNLQTLVAAPFLTPERATVSRPDTNTVSVNCSSKQSKLLVLTDTYYPGWNAFIDGKPARTWQTNYVFRGVFVPRGDHNVVFKYQPISLVIGLALAVAGITMLLATWRFARTRRNESTGQSDSPT